MEEGTSVDKMRPRMAPTGRSPLAKLLEEQAHGEDSNSKDTDVIASAKNVASRRKRNLSHDTMKHRKPSKANRWNFWLRLLAVLLCYAIKTVRVDVRNLANPTSGWFG